MFEVSCPSGLKGSLRGMKVRDEELFSNRKLVKSGKVLSQLLESCWLETKELGPYSFSGGKPNFDYLLGADRAYLLIQLRVASYGSDYDFRVTCSACKHHYMWNINLLELDVQPVSEAGQHHVQTGEPLTVTMKNGEQIRCRLLTGKDDEFFASLGTQDDGKILTHHLTRRIVEMQGKTHWREVMQAVEELEAADADFLWDATDELEGGVNTTFDIECPSCFRLQQVVLPFEASFFSNRKRFARSQMKENG
jgi:hypothetical protein